MRRMGRGRVDGRADSDHVDIDIATFADDQGSWQLVVFAKPGDVLDLSQEDGTARSPTTTILVK